jgi:hypothetical protein
MITTNNSDIKIEDYIELSEEEKELIERIKLNKLKTTDIDDNLISSVQRILYKLSKCCISIYDKIKKPRKKLLEFYKTIFLGWILIFKNLIIIMFGERLANNR